MQLLTRYFRQLYERVYITTIRYKFPTINSTDKIFKKRHEKDHKQSPQPATLSKKRLSDSCFPVNFAKFLRTRFLTKHHQTVKADNIAEKVFTQVTGKRISDHYARKVYIKVFL